VAPRGLPDPRDPATTLAEVERAISRLLAVPEITTADLAARLAQGEAPLLLDLRTAAEVAPSRLPGAIRLDPGATAREALAAHGEALRGAVLYCSVGWRSGLMAARLIEAGAGPVANLRGGLFRWHVEGRALAGGDAPHPFDAAWGALLRREVDAAARQS
jgi:rhodanese-related sulfurtransferase